MPITKHSYLVTDPAQIPRTIAEAFHIASTGRPGPVLVDIAKDAMQAMTTFSYPREVSLAGYRPTTKPHAKQIREAARLIVAAQRPVLYVGGGVDQGPGLEGAARPRRPARDAGGHDADGPRRLPRQPRPAPRHAGHARQRGGGAVAAAVGPHHQPREPASTTG
jgi:hypothetical protein